MPMSESEKLIRRLYNITADVDTSFGNQVRELLKLGCERFDLDIGILSNINGEKYTVMHRVCPPEVGLEVGAEFELGSTYCVKTLAANGPVGFDHVKESEMNVHPAYVAFGLEAYIGIPVKVDNKIYGTLNFSSPNPHERKFNAVDIDALSLMASWLGAEMQRRDNVAQLKAANKKLLAYSENLTKQADELKKARLLSEQASREKSKFLATMSHEIRTPMNGVLGMTELLKATDLDVVQKRYVGTILNSGNLLLSIINDILDYSKLDAGKLNIESIPFNLEWLAHDVLDMMACNEQRDVQLVLDYQPDAPRQFVGDPVRIRQILFNIVGNAVKFTERGYVRVAIKVDQYDEASSGVTISITDTGIGMEEELLQQMFKPFSQADLSTTRRYGGTGLGLAICQQLVGLMGGNITVRSEINKGSEFIVKLLLEKTEEEASINGKLLKGVKILLVEEDSVNRKALQKILHHLQTVVTVVSKPATVITELQKASDQNEAFQVVIIDQNLLKHDAVELCKLIRSSKNLQQPALLLMTAMDQSSDAKEFEEAGFSAYLNKPVRSDVFQSVLERIVGSSEGAPGIVTKYSVIEKENQKTEKIKYTGNILLVEDNEVNQIVAMTMLHELGFTVELAADGLKALDAINNNSYDLIFMDCQMPNMDGYEATRHIREKENTNRKTPIIALTANATEEDIKLCEEAGMDQVITKPFTPVNLIKILDNYAKRCPE